jgi:hypothetical protein
MDQVEQNRAETEDKQSTAETFQHSTNFQLEGRRMFCPIVRPLFDAVFVLPFLRLRRNIAIVFVFFL